jgi:hypothetical protein
MIVRLGIVGAGAAGLFTAMVLDYLNRELWWRAVCRDKGWPITPFPEDDSSSIHGLDTQWDPAEWWDTHKKPKALFFKYEILEANSSDRLGGRLFTYDFGGARDTHDYYDVGAMRFPDNPVMTRSNALFF